MSKPTSVAIADAAPLFRETPHRRGGADTYMRGKIRSSENEK